MPAIRILSSSGRPSRSPSMLLSMAAAATDPAPKKPPRILANLTNTPLKLVESRDPHREYGGGKEKEQADLPGRRRGPAEASPAAGSSDGLHGERTER
jgi:hypothetical protein